MSRLKSLKSLLISLLALSIIIIIVCISSKGHSCESSDRKLVNPFKKSYQAYSKAEACKKAMIMCSYYSTEPNRCAVLR